MDSGDSNTVPKHQLTEIEDFDADETVFLDTAHFVASDSAPTAVNLGIPVSVPVPSGPSSGRHAVLSEKQIDEVAQARLSSHTEKQTKRLVKLFKGMLMLPW